MKFHATEHASRIDADILNSLADYESGLFQASSGHAWEKRARMEFGRQLNTNADASKGALVVHLARLFHHAGPDDMEAVAEELNRHPALIRHAMHFAQHLERMATLQDTVTLSLMHAPTDMVENKWLEDEMARSREVPNNKAEFTKFMNAYAHAVAAANRVATPARYGR